MNTWQRFKTINGWVHDRRDPLRFAFVDNNQIMVTGTVYPTQDPYAACARMRREFRPLHTAGGEDLIDDVTVMSWRIDPDGYVYVARRHLLELM